MLAGTVFALFTTAPISYVHEVHTNSPTPFNALQAGTIFVMTHDSIGLGEDGPTHQPVEHLASFRAMPNILMMRPGDGNETAGCYKVITTVATTDSYIASSCTYSCLTSHCTLSMTALLPPPFLLQQLGSNVMLHVSFRCDGKFGCLSLRSTCTCTCTGCHACTAYVQVHVDQSQEYDMPPQQ